AGRRCGRSPVGSSDESKLPVETYREDAPGAPREEHVIGVAGGVLVAEIEHPRRGTVDANSVGSVSIPVPRHDHVSGPSVDELGVRPARGEFVPEVHEAGRFAMQTDCRWEAHTSEL